MKKNQIDRLSYSISPHRVRAELRPAFWGNGQIELFAELERPCVNEVVCFGYGDEGMRYVNSLGPRGAEEHGVTSVFDESKGRNYILHAPVASKAARATATFRPDRQIWRYTFDDLSVVVSLILPRLRPGYLYKVEVTPKDGNASRQWVVCHQFRGLHGLTLKATEAGSDNAGSRVWCRSPLEGHGQAIGATADATSIFLGRDGPYASEVMVKTPVALPESRRTAGLYLARAFADTIPHARENLDALLDSPQRLEKDSKAWWNSYLNEVPRLDAPDETLCRTVQWSWPNFRMSRIDLQRGKVPAGLFFSNNVSIKTKPTIAAGGDQGSAEAIQLLHDAAPARDLVLFSLRETRKHGILSPGWWGGAELAGGRIQCLGQMCGVAHKDMLTTGDFGLLEEDIGDGRTWLQRVEEALEAQLTYQDETTRLFWTEDDIKVTNKGGLAGGEGMNALRGRGSEVFFCHNSSYMLGTFRVFAEIEEIAGNHERRDRYRQMADEIREAIRAHLWNDELGFFCDRRRDGTFTEYRGISGFWTGLMGNQFFRPGGAATPEQAERLAAWCRHPDFVSDYGTVSLARSNPHYDPAHYKGFGGGFDMHWCNQVASGLYAHGCYEEAHCQMQKMFRRLGENGGLGPHYRGEGYHADTGEIVPWRFSCYPAIIAALTSIYEGMFGLRWTPAALTAHVNAPWPTAKLSNLRIRGSLLEFELQEDQSVVARINGEEVARSEDRKVELPWGVFE
jgi:hypothetical protein